MWSRVWKERWKGEKRRKGGKQHCVPLRFTCYVLRLQASQDWTAVQVVSRRWDRKLKGCVVEILVPLSVWLQLTTKSEFTFTDWKIVQWWRLLVVRNGESEFDSGEGALRTATTSKEGSRRVDYPMTKGLIRGPLIEMCTLWRAIWCSGSELDADSRDI